LHDKYYEQILLGGFAIYKKFGIGLTLIEDRLKSEIIRLQEVHPGNQEHIIRLLREILAEYFQELNRLLKEYGEIDYFKSIEEKINSKALIKYSLELSNFLTHLLRFIENQDYKLDFYLKYINDLAKKLNDKEKLIEFSYLPMAQEELINFHSQTFRAHLGKNLNKMLLTREKKNQEKI
jgi:hypothetical protein